MSSQPFSIVSLDLKISTVDLLQIPPPSNPLILRAIANLAYEANMAVQSQEYLQLSSTTPVNIFTAGDFPIVYVRNAGPSGTIVATAGFNAITGQVSGNSLAAPDFITTAYVVGDTGILLGGANNATYVVDAIDGFGRVSAYTITSNGSGYVTGIVSTARAGAQPGGGRGFNVDITSVTTQPQTTLTLSPGGVFLFYQPIINPDNSNTMYSLALASQTGGATIAEYLYAR